MQELVQDPPSRDSRRAARPDPRSKGGAKDKSSRGQRKFGAEQIIVIITALIVCGLVLIPFVTMLVSSLQPATSIPFTSGEFTTDNLKEVFGSGTTYSLLGNTAIYILASTLVAILIAAPFTWLVERTDMPFRNGIYTLLLMPIAVPSFVTALGWVLLLEPNSGVINAAIRDWLGWEMGRNFFDIYSFTGMVLITAVAIVPPMFLLLAGLFRNLNPQLEEASTTSGAGTLATARRITVPLMGPGLIAVLTYYFVAGLDFLEIPLVLGPNAGFRVLSLEIFSRSHPTPGVPLYGLAATYGLIAVAISIPIIYLYGRATRSSEKYAVVTGKLSSQHPVRLGKMKFVALGAIGAYLMVAVVLPVGIIVWASLLPFFQGFTAKAFDSVSLANYQKFFADPRLMEAVLNTVIMFVAAATCTMLLSALIAWIIVRFKVPGVRWLERIAFLPLAIPGIIIALAVLLFYIRTPLWGTVGIIVLGQSVRYLPIGVRFMHTAQLQIHKEMEEAGHTSGATSLRVFRTITLPLIRPSFLNGWLFVATSSLRDFTFPLLLVSANNVVITSLLWQLWNVPDVSGASAIATLIVIASMALMVTMRWLTTRQRRLPGDVTDPLAVRVGAPSGPSLGAAPPSGVSAAAPTSVGVGAP